MFNFLKNPLVQFVRMNRKDKAKHVKKSVLEVNCPQGYLLPNTLDSLGFARARINEINLISNELEQAKYSSTRRTFQQLSRHMRRRASSYNIKRLPTRLRVRALEEIKNDPPKGKCTKNMKNCRRWRRRSSNLTPEFKSKKGWLETHLWHAKRCKMVDYWGYKVASHLNEKCLKSTYRSSINGVLLHDFSYWEPFWMDSVDLEKLSINHGKEDILHFCLEYDNVQICPIKIIIRNFSKPLFYLHPASILSGIIEHAAFKNFIQNFSVSYSPASKDICTFMLQGPKAESVMTEFFNLKDAINFPLKIEFSDPRLGKVESKILSNGIDDLFLKSQNPSFTEDRINIMKSELLISNSLNKEDLNHPFVCITKNLNEYFLNCPRKWARIIWYNLIKIKPIKVAGIDQIDAIAFENEFPVFPRDFVRSPAYEIWSESEILSLEIIHNKKPPAKRPNYAKDGIESPFRAPFETLKCPLVKRVVEIEGKGIISERAEIYTESMILIGFVTSSTRASLKKGHSSGIASINTNFETETNILIRNYCSPNTFRSGKLSFIK